MAKSQEIAEPAEPAGGEIVGFGEPAVAAVRAPPHATPPAADAVRRPSEAGAAPIALSVPAAADDGSSIGLGVTYFAAAEFCVRLTGGKLLIGGWLFDPAALVSSVSVAVGPTAFMPALQRYYRADVLLAAAAPHSGAACGFVALAEAAAAKPGDAVRLHLHDPGGRSEIRAAIRNGGGELRRVLDEIKRSLAPETRLALFERLGAQDIAAELSEIERNLLVAAWSEAVGEIPALLDDPPTATKLYIDGAFCVGAYGILVNGWRNPGRDPLAAIDCMQVGGTRQSVSQMWTPMARPDVFNALRDAGELTTTDEVGFRFVLPTALDPALAPSYLAIAFSDGRQRRMRLDIRPSPSDPLAAVKALLQSFGQSERRLMELLERHIAPAIAAVWRSRPTGDGDSVELAFGEPPSDPEVSVIVPIYGRFDFIEYQLALFVDDPAMRQCELIYVIDDPSIFDQARAHCTTIAPIYDFPFRVLYGRRNRGFAGANNFGARHARGRKLLLLNSDVFPRKAGWLPALVAAYDALPAAGAIAPKLLFEDGSIQHAGIAFMRYPAWEGMWINDHPLKGQPDDETARAPQEFPAVTAACLMIDTALYREIGGLSEDYVIGDFEDTDLCLKLRAAGRRNWLVPAVALYHLERQSQALGDTGSWRANLTLYNCWLHHSRWDATIGAIVEGARPAAAKAAP